MNVLIAVLLIVLCMVLSYVQGHRVHRDLGIAVLRALIQLALLGHILAWIFTHSSMLLSISVGIVMTVNSALHSTSRIKSKYPGLFLDNLVATAVAIWPLSLLGTNLLDHGPWWEVEVFLPLIGMMLGNTLSGLSLGIDHFTHEVKEKKEEVLGLLAIGATVSESTEVPFRRALRISLTPTINSMLSMGLVSIPGTMTGQILSGVSPIEAAKIQMILMILISTTTYLGTLAGLLLSRNKLFNRRMQPCF